MKLGILKFLGVVSLIGGFGAAPAWSGDLSEPLVYHWGGSYVGVQAGGVIAKPNEEGTSSLPASANEVSVGAKMQMLFDAGNFVYGGVVDANYSSPLASQICPNPARTCEDGSGGNLSVRAKVGYAQDNWMLYGTAGWGWADYHKRSYITATGLGVEEDQRGLNGWVAGVGIDYALNANWVAELEYLHYDLGSSGSYLVPGGEIIRPSIDTLTLGISYRF